LFRSSPLGRVVKVGDFVLTRHVVAPSVSTGIFGRLPEGTPASTGGPSRRMPIDATDGLSPFVIGSVKGHVHCLATQILPATCVTRGSSADYRPPKSLTWSVSAA
jgi:hypothetical protein